MTRIALYQNFHDAASRGALEPGYLPLDNTAQERPDWYEYWPIRGFLLREPLDEETWYGFFSAKFRAKTGLPIEAVRAFIAGAPAGTDVVLFSPNVHLTSHRLNVFTSGEEYHPGLLEASRRFVREVGIDVDLAELVSDSTNTVYSNYFVAKPRFWRRWLEINERLFAICETPAHPLNAALTANTAYRGGHGVQMKIFVMERIATLIISTEPGFRALAHDPFVTQKRAYKLPLAILCDALKIAYRTTGNRHYRRLFETLAARRAPLNALVRVGGLLGLYRPQRR